MTDQLSGVGAGTLSGVVQVPRRCPGQLSGVVQKFAYSVSHSMLSRGGAIGLFTCFRSDADKKKTRASKRIGTLKKRGGFGCSFGRIEVVLLTSCMSKDKKVVQSISRSVLQQLSDPWSTHRIRKRLIVSLDILITSTLKTSMPIFRHGILFAWSNSLSDAAEYMVCKKLTFWVRFWAEKLKMRLKPHFRHQNPSARMRLFGDFRLSLYTSSIQSGTTYLHSNYWLTK